MPGLQQILLDDSAKENLMPVLQFSFTTTLYIVTYIHLKLSFSFTVLWISQLNKYQGPRNQHCKKNEYSWSLILCD